MHSKNNMLLWGQGWASRLGRFALGLVCGAALWSTGAAQSTSTTLRLETWRIDDQTIWTQRILPEFTRAHPSIQVRMRATLPVQYDNELQAALRRGSAGDIITCRPFDQSIALYDQGHLQDITNTPVLRRFRGHSKIAWTTYYADRVYCVPVAAVMTGFFYNTRIFQELKLTPPRTEEELFATLEKIKKSGKYVPVAFGTQDAWLAAQVLFAGIGPNHWQGEQGRKNLLTGRAKFTDEPYVSTWQTLARLANYMPPNHAHIKEEDARQLFLSGGAAIYPAGSWEIPFLSRHPNAAEFGVFAPPPKAKAHNCYVLNHLDMGMGINAKSPHPMQAAQFVDWLGTADFANTLANQLHGFFPLSNHPIRINNPLANEMLSWRQLCDTTIRINSQYLNQAWPQLEQELWHTTVRVMRKQITPEAAARHISRGVEKWFRPI